MTVHQEFDSAKSVEKLREIRSSNRPRSHLGEEGSHMPLPKPKVAILPSIWKVRDPLEPQQETWRDRPPLL
jgi:hypothetical protein